MTLDWGGKPASEKWAFERGGSKAAQGVDKTEKQDGNWKLEKIKTNKKINRIEYFPIQSHCDLSNIGHFERTLLNIGR